jgi:hypothetical protein
MIQFTTTLPRAARSVSICEPEHKELDEFEEWFRDHGAVAFKLMYGEIPLVGFNAAYGIRIGTDTYQLHVYVEDHTLGMLAKLRWGGTSVRQA